MINLVGWLIARSFRLRRDFVDDESTQGVAVMTPADERRKGARRTTRQKFRQIGLSRTSDVTCFGYVKHYFVHTLIIIRVEQDLSLVCIPCTCIGWSRRMTVQEQSFTHHVCGLLTCPRTFFWLLAKGPSFAVDSVCHSGGRRWDARARWLTGPKAEWPCECTLLR